VVLCIVFPHVFLRLGKVNYNCTVQSKTFTCIDSKWWLIEFFIIKLVLNNVYFDYTSSWLREKGLNVLLFIYKIQCLVHNVYWLVVLKLLYICSRYIGIIRSFSTSPVYSYTIYEEENKQINYLHTICEKYYERQWRKMFTLVNLLNSRIVFRIRQPPLSW